MEIDYQLIQSETLIALIEGFILREGTDYGASEVPLETKVEQILVLLKRKKIKIVFDPETETCNLQEAHVVHTVSPENTTF